MFKERQKELFNNFSKFLTDNKITYTEFKTLVKVIEQNYSYQLGEIEKKLNYEYRLRYDFEQKKDSNMPS